MKIVLVEWVDSCSGNSWTDRDTGWFIDKVTSVGILKSEDEEKIELVPNIGDLKLHQIAIPRGCIKRIRTLCLK